MKLTDYIADILSKEVNHVFVGNGGVVVHLLDSLNNHPKIKVIPCENEQGAAIAAEAYSRINRNLGVAVATSGPGAINLLQGIACAYYDSIPTLFITGAPPVPHLKGYLNVRQRGFQEMDIVKVVKTFTKHAILITKPEDIHFTMEQLIYIAKEGRPGPVLLDLPDDIQRADIDPNKLKSFIPYDVREGDSYYDYSEEIERMKDMISRSERPLIIVGGGVKQAKCEEIMKFLLNRWEIPIVTTWATIDMFLDDDLNLVGNFGVSANRPGNFAIQTADLIISFGSRLDTHETGSNFSKFASNAKKIIIDTDSAELSKLTEMNVVLKILIGLSPFLEKLRPIMFKTKDLTKWKNKIEEWKRNYPICPEEYYDQKRYVNPYVFMNELSKETDDGDIIITDAGGTLTWTMQGYKMRHKQQLFSAFNHSPMGYALPASIGAKFATPNRRVICIIGDGGMNMNIQELETVIFNKLPIKIFVMNNREYGIIKQTQDTWLDSYYVASDENSGLGFPDLVRIAQAYGYETVQIEDYKELVQKIKYVLGCSSPVFCSVNIKSNEQIIPKLVFGRPLEDMAPFLDKEELKRNLIF